MLFYMLKLINRRDLMGRHTNSRWANFVAVSTSVIMVILTGVKMWTTIAGR